MSKLSKFFALTMLPLAAATSAFAQQDKKEPRSFLISGGLQLNQLDYTVNGNGLSDDIKGIGTTIFAGAEGLFQKNGGGMRGPWARRLGVGGITPTWSIQGKRTNNIALNRNELKAGFAAMFPFQYPSPYFYCNSGHEKGRVRPNSYITLNVKGNFVTNKIKHFVAINPQQAIPITGNFNFFGVEPGVEARIALARYHENHKTRNQHIKLGASYEKPLKYWKQDPADLQNRAAFRAYLGYVSNKFWAATLKYQDGGMPTNFDRQKQASLELALIF